MSAAGVFTAVVLAGAVLHVDDDAAPGGDGSSWASAYDDLALALAAAAPGDELRVAGGRYLPGSGGLDPLSTFELPEGVAVLGGFAGLGAPDPDLRDPLATPSVLDGDLLGDDVPGDPEAQRLDNVRAVITLRPDVGAGQPAVLDGLTVRGGNARFATSGGGIRASGGALVLRGCAVLENRAEWLGGGLFADDAELLVEDCTFAGNLVRGTSATNASAGGGGLAIRWGQARVVDTHFVGNEVIAPAALAGTAKGGGAWLGGVSGQPVDLELLRCVVADNRAVGLDGGTSGGGGGVFLTDGCRLVATVVSGNSTASPTPGLSTSFGGGVELRDGAVLEACRILGNRVDGQSIGGGGVIVRGTGGLVSNCEISGNGDAAGAFLATDGGLRLESAVDARVVGCTVVGNVSPDPGAGITVAGLSSGVVVVDTIVWGNVGAGLLDEAAQFVDGPGAASVDHCIVQGLTGALGGMGNQGADPLLVDADGADGVPGTVDDDLRLAAGSPAIDAGDAAALAADLGDRDCDGDTAEPVPLDIGGWLRRQDDPSVADAGPGAAPHADIGAHEHGLALPTEVWVDLGGGTASPAGAPVFSATGTLCVDQLVVLGLQGAPPGAAVLLLQSIASSPLPKYGGVIHPLPILSQVFLGADAGGAFLIGAPLPGALPSGLPIYLQCLVHDPGSAPPVLLSNGVRGTAP